MAEQAAETGYEPRERYGSFETGDGDVVVYDRNDPTAWLQSDTLADVED